MNDRFLQHLSIYKKNENEYNGSMMKTIREFLEEQINEQLIQAVVSGRRTGEGPSKVKLRPVELKGKLCYQASVTEGTEVYQMCIRDRSKAYAYGILHDWNMADDVSQDVLYKMYNMRKGLNVDNEKMMYSLIRRSSVNKAMDYKKKSSSRHEFVCTEDRCV